MIPVFCAMVGALSIAAQSTPPQQFQAAVAAQQRGDIPTAMRLYRALLRAHPTALPARVNLGSLLVDADSYDEAIALYRAGLKLSPTSKDLHAGLGFALGRRGTSTDLKQAIAELEPLHRRDATDDATSMLLADAYVRSGRFVEALPLLAGLEQRHSGDRDIAWLTGIALIRSGHLRDGVRRIDVIAAAEGSADAYLLAGEARLDLQQFDLAKADAEASLARDPNLAGGATLLGRAEEHLGNYAAAETWLRRAIAADTNDFEAQFYLGALFLFQRNLPEAEEHLRRALALQPASAEARYKLVQIEESNGPREAELRDLQIVVAQRPTWLEPHSKLLALLYRMDRTEDAEKLKIIVERLKVQQSTAAPEQALP